MFDDVVNLRQDSPPRGSQSSAGYGRAGERRQQSRPRMQSSILSLPTASSLLAP